MSNARFEVSDFGAGVLAPGRYECEVVSAQLRRSRQGHHMVEVVLTLVDADAGSTQVRDYFVLEGVSPRGLAVARSRLVELYRACEVEPQPGDEIAPEQLVDARIEVKLDHEERDGQWRLRAVGYRAVPRRLTDDPPF